jgi:hypothetical protein
MNVTGCERFLNMNNTLADLSLNVFLPLLLGVMLYKIPTVRFVRNYLADGLWAYAFMSTMLIVWDRKINFYWLFFVFASFVIFEVLQKMKVIPGTGDIIDVIVYFLFSFLAILANYLLTKPK